MYEIELAGSYFRKEKTKENLPDETRRGSEKETGFPSPAWDHPENTNSPDEYLIRRPAATFFVRVNGDGMNRAGIRENDLLVIDHSIKPAGGKPRGGAHGRRILDTSHRYRKRKNSFLDK